VKENSCRCTLFERWAYLYIQKITNKALNVAPSLRSRMPESLRFKTGGAEWCLSVVEHLYRCVKALGLIPSTTINKTKTTKIQSKQKTAGTQDCTLFAMLPPGGATLAGKRNTRSRTPAREAPPISGVLGFPSCFKWSCKCSGWGTRRGCNHFCGKASWNKAGRLVGRCDSPCY
jgi:hypothetical protein